VFSNGTDVSHFAHAIDDLFARVNAHLMALLARKYSLAAHAHALKRFVLLAQGDFVQHLLDGEHAHLDRPRDADHSKPVPPQTPEQAFTAAAFHLQSRGSVTATSASAAPSGGGAVPEFVRAHLHLYRPPPGSAASAARAQGGVEAAWDQLSLVYTFEQTERDDNAPLAVIFSSGSAPTKYADLCSFLLRLKRVERVLNLAWKEQSKVGHSIKLRELARSLSSATSSISGGSGFSSTNNPVDPLLKQANGLRHEMMHFLSNTHSYIMFEVLETAWDEFAHKIRAVQEQVDQQQQQQQQQTQTPAAVPAPISATAAAAAASFGATATAAAQPISSRHTRASSSMALVPLSSTTTAAASSFGAVPSAAAAVASSSSSSALMSMMSKERVKPLDLDGLIHAHRVFLSTIHTKALFGGPDGVLLPALLGLFKLVLSFAQFNERLHAFLRAEFERRDRARMQAGRSEAQGKWGVSAARAVAGGATNSATLVSALAGFLAELQRLAHDWGGQFRAFRAALKQTPGQRDAAERLGGRPVAGSNNLPQQHPQHQQQSHWGGGVDDDWAGNGMGGDGEEDDPFGSPDAATAASNLFASPRRPSTSSRPGEQQQQMQQLLQAREAAQRHDRDFLRFRLDFNEFFKLNREAHLRRAEAYERAHGGAEALAKQRAAAQAQQAAAQRAQQAARPDGNKASFYNPQAWHD
jgi:hypothetical protein